MGLLPKARSAVLAAIGLTAAAPTASAGDVTAFAAFPSPRQTWARGYGAALTSTWFHVLAFEAEAARIPGEAPDVTMTTFTGSALLAPPIGALVPYGGVGIGLFRQTVGANDDTGVLRCFILGAKLKLGLLVLKGEYRTIELPDDVLLPMDRRIAAGAGISF